MSEFAEIVATNPGSEVVGGSRVQNVLVIGFTTKPHGIYAEVRYPVSAGPPTVGGTIDPTQVIPVVDNIAQSLEIIANRADVAAIVYVQNVDDAGFLQDQVEITVQGSDPSFTSTFTWGLSKLNEFVVGPVIQREVDALNELAAA